MPVQIKYTDDGLGVRFIAHGIATGDEIIEANKKVNTHENFSGLKYKIADRSACNEYRVSGEDVKIIAGQEREAAELNPELVVAMIAPSDLQFGISRMYQSLMADMGFECEIFRSPEEADRWIAAKLETKGLR